MQASFHVEGSEDLLPPHPLPAALRVCGKLPVLDSLLSKLLPAKHKVCSGHGLSMSHHSAPSTLRLRTLNILRRSCPRGRTPFN